MNERYYMGRHKIDIIDTMNNKCYIMHLENGYVGNKREGYKDVFYGDYDIVPFRLCFKKKKSKFK